MPDFAIVDTHVHLWDPAEIPMDWCAGAPALSRPFGLAELDEARGAVQLEQVVFVECDVVPGRSLDEARRIATMAEADPRLAGIVAHAALEDGAKVAPHLEALAGLGLVKGVRRLLQNEADDAFCLRPDFQAGLALLPNYGFHFELCIFHRQFPAVLELVARHPEVRFVLDHIGKPGIKAGIVEPWWTFIKALAAFPNVICKLSGVATEADHAGWREAEIRPYMDRALDVFGSERVMFGGDWPVSILALPYADWVEVVDRATAHLSREERQRIFRDNAKHWYRLPG
ncbi:MAG TPA: amidohydrolase family protein [Geminicoccus sp.]|uniref:amidohydrolase family protein n=1 Tax=Geminicoccus sp. TaxID=2024832 RepID=UPI002D1629AA|nr:amidohydrolase family protein [Geminicoccus sp.]HWL69496.1 amidohydrolase family protein [Geminicoccus sp.]